MAISVEECLSGKRPARPVVAKVPLGMNVGFPEFVDAIKGTSNWGEAAVDEHGWPTTDASVVVLDDRVNQPWNGPDPHAVAPDDSGTYRLSFAGRADVVSWTATVRNPAYDSASNTTTADVVLPAGNPFLQLFFNNTRRSPADTTATGVTAVRLTRPGYDRGTTKVFTDRYVAALRPFDTLRYMDSTFTNGYGPEWAGRPLDWSMRHLPTDCGVAATHGSVPSAAWEDLIGLANATHTHMWINVPGPASDDYVRHLALLIRDGGDVDGVHYPRLDPDLKVYVEWSNEVWGGINSTYAYNVADIERQVQAGGSMLISDGNPGTDTWVTGPTLLRNALLHTRAIASVFEAIFHDPAHDRIRPVLCWQGGNTWAFPAAFDWFRSLFGEPANYFHGMGGFTYYNPTDYSSVDVLLASLSTAQAAFMAGVKETTAVAARYGLVNVSYEGGPSIGGSGDAGQIGLAANRDPRIKAIVAQGYADWYANGGNLVMFYDGPYGIWNPQWQLHAAELSQADDPSASPKYAGLMDVLRTGNVRG